MAVVSELKELKVLLTILGNSNFNHNNDLFTIRSLVQPPIYYEPYKRGVMKILILLLLTLSLNGFSADHKNNYSSAKPYPAEPTRIYELKGDLEQIKFGCCRVCTVGCACGDSCISCSKNCSKGVGCACNG